MDWLKLFALLVALEFAQITADAPKKKIRIHLPQKVKHIHHHKKIYITNHPASSQYAPAFMRSVEGAVAVPTNVAMPAVASVSPLNSLELYDESSSRLPGISSAASKLLSLYRARGYYGPTPTEWEERDYELELSAEPIQGPHIRTAYVNPSADPTLTSNFPQKKRKIVNLNKLPRKKISRKNKPKKLALRNKESNIEDEHPVTTFHEKFYSDIDGSGTIRKIKKPQRVEKIIDGDTEHIHTYSEEHIHKIVFDDRHKLPSMAGVNPIGSNIVAIKNQQALVAIPPVTTGFTAIGSMGTPSHLEYASYNPQEVTHDHIIHDHGEIPSGVDFIKDPLLFPPRTSHVSQSFLFGNVKGLKNKNPLKYSRPSIRPVTDFSYHENINRPYNRHRNVQKPTITESFESSEESSLDDLNLKPVVPSFKFLNKGNINPYNVVPELYFHDNKQVTDVRLQQTSVHEPYLLSSTIVHEYKPKHYSGYPSETMKLAKSNKDVYTDSDSEFEYDSYASASNLYATENYPPNIPVKKGNKKSISSQNISFGGLDHQTTVNHLQDPDIAANFQNGRVPTAFESNYDEKKPLEAVPSTAFSIRDSSPVHPYYTAMAIKALHSGDQLTMAEASNNNFQYAEPPSPSSSTVTNVPSLEGSTISSVAYHEKQKPEPTESTKYEIKSRATSNGQSSANVNEHKERRSRYKIIALQPKEPTHTSVESRHNYYNEETVSATPPSKLKYGDKI